jgi:hypothetical protein
MRRTMGKDMAGAGVARPSVEMMEMTPLDL